MLAMGPSGFYSSRMTIEQLKSELRDASPEAQSELFTFLVALRRSNAPGRPRQLATLLDEPTRWVKEEDAARRLGMEDECR